MNCLYFILLVTLTFLLSDPANAQHNAPFPYDYRLAQVKQPDSIRQYNAFRDSINQIMIQPSKEEVAILLSDQWTLSHYLNWGWEETLGSGNARGINDWYIGNDPAETLTTADILKTLQFPDSLISKNLAISPTERPNRVARFQDKILLFPCREYLLASIVEKYPYGSMTSYYRTYNYFFKRVPPIQ